MRAGGGARLCALSGCAERLPYLLRYAACGGCGWHCARVVQGRVALRARGTAHANARAWGSVAMTSLRSGGCEVDTKKPRMLPCGAGLGAGRLGARV